MTDIINIIPPAERFDWRKHLIVHPAADLLPLMSEPELETLARDIHKNGLLTPIVLWRENWNDDSPAVLSDGRNRLDALAALGWLSLYPVRERHPRESREYVRNNPPFDINDECVLNALDGGFDATGFETSDVEDPYALVLSLNHHRRHLTPDQKRDLIDAILKARPEQSNRQIAKQVKGDHKKVADRRSKLESTGEIPQLDKTVGADGKARKTKPKADKKLVTVQAQAKALGLRVRPMGSAYLIADAIGTQVAVASDLNEVTEKLAALGTKAAPPNQVAEPEKKPEPEPEPEADVEPLPIWCTELDYSDLMKLYEKLQREHRKLQGKQPLAKGDDEEGPTVNDWDELTKRERKLEARIAELSAALNAKEAQESRNWPADMTKKQLKLRDKCLGGITYWQRELEQLYGEVTGQSSWRVVVTTKDGKRLGTGARFGTRGEAELYNAKFAPSDHDGVGEDYASGEVIPCAEEKANVLIVGDSIRGGYELMYWRPVGDDDPTDDDAPTSGEKRKAVNAEKFAALDAGSEA